MQRNLWGFNAESSSRFFLPRNEPLVVEIETLLIEGGKISQLLWEIPAIKHPPHAIRKGAKCSKKKGKTKEKKEKKKGTGALSLSLGIGEKERLRILEGVRGFHLEWFLHQSSNIVRPPSDAPCSLIGVADTRIVARMEGLLHLTILPIWQWSILAAFQGMKLWYEWNLKVRSKLVTMHR